MASPYTYEQMKARQKALGPTGPAGPVSAAEKASMDDTVLDQPALEPEPIVADTVEVTPETKPQGMDMNRAKRAVVMNALRNSPAARAMFARHVRNAYQMGTDFKATDDEILKAGFDLQKESIPDLTPHEYEKAIHDEYGPVVDKALLKQGHIDYPGHTDETKLIDEMYKRKVAKEEMGPLSTADKAMIVARRFHALNDTNMSTDKALRLRYTEEKKRGRNVGSFDDWLHAQMAPTLAENVRNVGGSIANMLGEQGKQVGRFTYALTDDGRMQMTQDIAAASTGDKEAQQRLKEAGLGAVTVASLAAGPLVKGGLGAAEEALAAAKLAPVAAVRTAPALAGAAEGAVVGGLQGGGSAAVEGKPIGDIAQEAATGAGIGGGAGAVIGGIGGAMAARKTAQEAAQEAEALAAAKAAGAGEVPPPTPVVPPAPPVTDIGELA